MIMQETQPLWFGDIVRQYDAHHPSKVREIINAHVGQPLVYHGNIEGGRASGDAYEMHYQAQAIEKTTGYGKVVALFTDPVQIGRVRTKAESDRVETVGRTSSIERDGLFVTVTIENCTVR